MPEPVVTAANWKKAATHIITLPSNVQVEIRIPDLPGLIEAGKIPQSLLDAALNASNNQAQVKVTPEMMKEQKAFTDKVVQITVVKPKLDDADLDDLPYEDKEMIVQIAMRDRDFDAVGDHIGGLSENEKFRRFRQLD